MHEGAEDQLPFFIDHAKAPRVNRPFLLMLDLVEVRVGRGEQRIARLPPAWCDGFDEPRIRRSDLFEARSDRQIAVRRAASLANHRRFDF